MSKYWVFTWNNPDAWCDLPEGWKGTTWGCYQLEQGASGTRHYQGYVVFKVAKRLSSLKNLAPTVHWEARKGTHQQAKDYALKDDETTLGFKTTWGSEEGLAKDHSKKGQRSDLLQVKEKLDAGAPIGQIAQEHFGSWVRYHKSFTTYAQSLQPVRTWVPSVYVLWGETGTGKTSWVYRNFAIGDVYRVPKTNAKTTWLDGYQGQKVCVFDDFLGGVRYSLLLELLDRYPVQAEAKGTFVNFNPRVIVITSNKHPSDWYKSCYYAALERRLTVIARVDKGDDWDKPVIVPEKGVLPSTPAEISAALGITEVPSESSEDEQERMGAEDDSPEPSPHPLETQESADSDGSEDFA